jgi:hypothetical protein
MVRVIFFITLILNFSLFAWLFLNKKPAVAQGQQRFVQQLEPNSIQIIANTESQTTTKMQTVNQVAQGIQTCLETNLANEQEIEYIQKAVATVSLNIKQDILNKSVQGKFLVYQTASNTEQTLQKFRQKNITPLSIMRNANDVLLGLGVFTNNDEANSYQKKLSGDFQNIKVLEQDNIQMNVFWLRFPELNLEQNRQIKDLARQLKLSIRFCGNE